MFLSPDPVTTEIIELPGWFIVYSSAPLFGRVAVGHVMLVDYLVKW